MTEGGNTSAFLRLLAGRASTDPAYVAWVVRAHAEALDLSTAEVLSQLGVAEAVALDFLVSLRPAGARFADMLATICTRFVVDECALLSMLRQVEVTDAFRAGTRSSLDGPDWGILTAARMRESRPRPRKVAEEFDGSEDDSGGRGDDDAR